MFFRAAYRSELTAAIDSGKITKLEDVVCDKNFAAAWKNGADSLINFLKATDPDSQRPRMEMLVDLALSPDPVAPPGTPRRICTPNRESAFALGEISRKMVDLFSKDPYLYKSLHELMKKPLPKEQQCAMAGRVSRILELHMRHNAKRVFEVIPLQTVVKFLLDNSELLAYANLLMSLPSSFQDVVEQYPGKMKGFLVAVLDEAVQYVFGEGAGEEKDERTPMEVEIHKRQRDRRKEQPLTVVDDVSGKERKKQFPWPKHGEYKIKVERDRKFQERKGARAKRFVKSGKRVSEMKAYLLLRGIVEGIMEVPSMVAELQNEECVERLVICGVYAPSTSMVAQCAFKILGWILMGYDPGESEFGVMDKIPGKRSELQKVVDQYADDIIFDGGISPKKIAALACFWDHRYKHLKIETHENVVCELEPLDDGSTEEYNLAFYKEATPFEYYGRYLLYEPPISDALNRELQRAWETLNTESEPLRDQVDRQKEILDKYDAKWLRFLLQKVQEGETMLTALQKATSLCPASDKESAESKRYASQMSGLRACLNGFVHEVWNFHMNKSMLTLDNIPFEFVSSKELLPIVDCISWEARRRADLITQYFNNAPKPIHNEDAWDKTENWTGSIDGSWSFDRNETAQK